MPDAGPLVQPFLAVLPLQLAAYTAIAIAKGNDVDQPGNLAKRRDRSRVSGEPDGLQYWMPRSILGG